MYTLVGAPLLGFDLARRAGGADVADLLQAALACGTDRLVELGEGPTRIAPSAGRTGSAAGDR